MPFPENKIYHWANIHEILRDFLCHESSRTDSQKSQQSVLSETPSPLTENRIIKTFSLANDHTVLWGKASGTEAWAINYENMVSIRMQEEKSLQVRKRQRQDHDLDGLAVWPRMVASAFPLKTTKNKKQKHKQKQNVERKCRKKMLRGV